MDFTLPPFGAQSLSLGVLEPGAFAHVFLVRFDPVVGYPALGGLEIQLAGAYELWSFLSSASFTYGFQGEVLVD